MDGITRARLLTAAVVFIGAIGLAGCGSDTGPPYEATSSVVSGENTQEIGIWAPDADGAWPVVVGFHGLGGTKEAWDGLATELAQQGIVVFVPDYRSTGSVDEIKKDLVCANQYAGDVAGDYGGDSDQPWTLVGHSLGASLVLVPKDEVLQDTAGALDECVEGWPDADAIVSMVGCHVEYEGEPAGALPLPPSGIPVTFVASENDETCPAWQSEDAATALTDAGYETTLVTIPGGTHGTPLFLDDSQDPWAPLPGDDPGGQEAVTAILSTIESAQS